MTLKQETRDGKWRVMLNAPFIRDAGVVALTPANESFSTIGTRFEEMLSPPRLQRVAWGLRERSMHMLT